MNRLIQGDVGSGKTVVAALATMMITRAGAQAAVMAPTSILAEQHFKNFSRFLVGEGCLPKDRYACSPAIRPAASAKPSMPGWLRARSKSLSARTRSSKTPCSSRICSWW